MATRSRDDLGDAGQRRRAVDADRPALLSDIAVPQAGASGPRRALPVLVALAVAVSCCWRCCRRSPCAPTWPSSCRRARPRRARLVMAEARTGTATGLILIGIEGAGRRRPGADQPRRWRPRCPATGLFQLVAGGEAALPRGRARAAVRRPLRCWRRPISARPALRAGMEGVLRQLRVVPPPRSRCSSVWPTRRALPAPCPRLGRRRPVRSVDGAWFAPDRDRALLLARTKAGGMDVPAQEAATGGHRGGVPRRRARRRAAAGRRARRCSPATPRARSRRTSSGSRCCRRC